MAGLTRPPNRIRHPIHLWRVEGDDCGIGVHAPRTLPRPPVLDLHRGQPELGYDLLLRFQPDPHVLQLPTGLPADALCLDRL